MSVQVSQPILLVEDSPEDFEMTQRCLKAAGLRNPIQRCTDGDEALEYLEPFRMSGSGMGSTCPGIILLDLNMPGTDGREVLAELKADSRLKLIPVVVLSTSTDDRDIAACYALGASSYISKPLNAEEFLKAMARLKDYWFEVVLIPKIGEQL